MNGIIEQLGNKPRATLSIHRHEKSRFPSYYLWPPPVKVKVGFFWPKIRSLGPPVARLWPNTFQYILIYFTKSWFALVFQQLDQKQNCFMEDMHWTTPGLR